MSHASSDNQQHPALAHRVLGGLRPVLLRGDAPHIDAQFVGPDNEMSHRVGVRPQACPQHLITEMLKNIWRIRYFNSQRSLAHARLALG